MSFSHIFHIFFHAYIDVLEEKSCKCVEVCFAGCLFLWQWLIWTLNTETQIFSGQVLAVGRQLSCWVWSAFLRGNKPLDVIWRAPARRPRRRSSAAAAPGPRWRPTWGWTRGTRRASCTRTASSWCSERCAVHSQMLWGGGLVGYESWVILHVPSALTPLHAVTVSIWVRQFFFYIRPPSRCLSAGGLSA